MIAKTPEERRYYQSRLKMQRDEQARLEAAEERGEAKGKAIGRIQALQPLVGLPESTDEELRNRPIEELELLATNLQRQLRERA